MNIELDNNKLIELVSKSYFLKSPELYFLPRRQRDNEYLYGLKLGIEVTIEELATLVVQSREFRDYVTDKTYAWMNKSSGYMDSYDIDKIAENIFPYLIDFESKKDAFLTRLAIHKAKEKKKFNKKEYDAKWLLNLAGYTVYKKGKK